jgi:hypothetical protein
MRDPKGAAGKGRPSSSRRLRLAAFTRMRSTLQVPPFPLKRPTKKLLVAAVGVATVSYVACGDTSNPPPPPVDAQADMPVSGNLVPPPDATVDDGGDPADMQPDLPVSGNLVPPPDATVDDGGDPADMQPDLPVSGNLVPPPEEDGGA